MGVITEKTGDIFSVPAHSVLIHACNAKGRWGAGVALAFKQKYPKAFKIYAAHCNSVPPPTTTSLPQHQRALAGTALLIPPPPPSDPCPSASTSASASRTTNISSSSTHWIACLFTSVAYGRGRDSEAQILHNTRRAIADLAQQLEAYKEEEEEGLAGEGGEKEVEKPERESVLGKCYAVPINSGKNGVPWRLTKEVLEDGELDIVVVDNK